MKSLRMINDEKLIKGLYIIAILGLILFGVSNYKSSTPKSDRITEFTSETFTIMNDQNISKEQFFLDSKKIADHFQTGMTCFPGKPDYCLISTSYKLSFMQLVIKKDQNE